AVPFVFLSTLFLRLQNRASIIMEVDDEELRPLKDLLDDLCASSLPITKEKISKVAECALRYVQKYKKVVHMIERYAKHYAGVRYRSAVICVIDSLCTKAHRAHKEKDVFIPRFRLRLLETLQGVTTLEGRSERALMDRIFVEWRKRGWFDVPPLATLAGEKEGKPTRGTQNPQGQEGPRKRGKKRTGSTEVLESTTPPYDPPRTSRGVPGRLTEDGMTSPQNEE
ncbi:b chain of rna processing factor scaf8, partial [Nannochloropsis gaditana CCMP526]